MGVIDFLYDSPRGKPSVRVRDSLTLALSEERFFNGVDSRPKFFTKPFGSSSVVRELPDGKRGVCWNCDAFGVLVCRICNCCVECCTCEEDGITKNPEKTKKIMGEELIKEIKEEEVE